MNLPLSGFTVFELGSALAGPYAARILADLGARVIKIEQPGTGEPSRSWGEIGHKGLGSIFHAVNRGKDSLTVDFTDADDVARLRSLIATHADAVLQNLRPDVTIKAGLDADSIRTLNPAIVYANVSAYGSSGPLAMAPGYEALMQAFSGIMEMTGSADGDPARVGFSVNDFGTGMWTAIGILTGLLARTKSGDGCTVDTSVLDTALGWQVVNMTELQSKGAPPPRTGMRGPLLSPNGGYRCCDGMLMMTVGTEAQFGKLCDALDRADLKSDPRFADNSARMAHDGELKAELEKTLSQNTRAHWWDLLSAAKVPAAPIQTLDEAMAHPQTVASGILQNGPDAALPAIGMPVKFNGQRLGFRKSGPALNEGTDDLRKDD